MHTHIVEVERDGTVPYTATYRVHHNGDWSGDIKLIVGKGEVSVEHLPPDVDTVEVEFPFEVMLECVGEYLRDRHIGRLEEISGRDYIAALYEGGKR